MKSSNFKESIPEIIALKKKVEFLNGSKALAQFKNHVGGDVWGSFP